MAHSEETKLLQRNNIIEKIGLNMTSTYTRV